MAPKPRRPPSGKGGRRNNAGAVEDSARNGKQRADGPRLARAALMYAERGWAVFPLNPNTKTPHKQLVGAGGLHKATTDPATIKEWWRKAPRANIGLVTGSGSGLVVVDLDPGAPSLDLPPTRKVRTPSGGTHLIYEHPGREVRNSAGKLAEHVDIRGDGGYVVAPPSVVDGKPYRRVGKRDLAPFPPDLLAALTAGHENGNGSAPSGEPVLPGGRHAALVSMAGRLRSQGLDGDAIEAILHVYNKQACRPPKERGDVRRIAHDVAGRYAPDEAGDEVEVEKEARRIRVREQARRRVAEEQAGPPYEFPAPGRTLADDLAHPPIEQKFTIEELHTAGGNTLVVAQFKAGKTTLALNLIAALADGEPFLGAYAVNEPGGRVAWWNYELSADMAREWMRDVDIKNPDRVAEPLHLRGVALPMWRDDVKQRAVEWLRANEVSVWIIDPAAMAWRGLVENENDNSQIAAFTAALDEIKREAGVRDLFLLTHMGRATMEEGAERSRGGTRLEDWMDHGWYLTKDGKEHDAPRALRAMGRDVDVPAMDLMFDDATRRLRATGKSRAERRADDGARKVVGAILQLKEGVATTVLVKELGGHKGDSRQTLWVRQAVAAGFIERRYKDGSPVDEAEPKNGVGLYCFTTKAGREAMAPRVPVKTSADDE